MSINLFSQETVVAYLAITYTFTVALLLWSSRDSSPEEAHAKWVLLRIIFTLLAPILLPLALLAAVVVFPANWVATYTNKKTTEQRLRKLKGKIPFAEQTLLAIVEESYLIDVSVVVDAVLTVEQAQHHLPELQSAVEALRCKLITHDGRLLLEEPEVWSIQQTLGIDGGRSQPILCAPALDWKPQPHQDWVAVFTAPFKKEIQRHDKKLQGRILDAIIEILEAPTVTRGDTVKPLSKNMGMKWRYRIGDFRLVYVPVVTHNKVLFVSFAARGSVYD